jgi:hypothetical protein
LDEGAREGCPREATNTHFKHASVQGLDFVIMTFYCVFICTELLAVTILVMAIAVTISAECIKIIKILMLRKCETVALAVTSVKKN